MTRVQIYTTATCGFCKAEKAFLDEQGVKYEELRADENHRLAQELFELSGQLGVPFTVVTGEDGQKVGVIGFDRPRLSEVLGL